MPQITANNISIEYDERGEASNPVILLISGLGSQMTNWHDPFLEGLAAEGFRVIRYDNRDIGLSQYFDDAGVPNMKEIAAKAMAGEKPQVAYNLDDMAADAIGVLDALGIDRAHIVGTSMGGMIAQLVAANYPDRCLSLNSIMSSSSRRGLPSGTPEATEVLTARPEGEDRESRARHDVKVRKTIGSPGFQASDEEMYAKALNDGDRAYHPDGKARQYAATFASGSRKHILPNIKVPTMVMHGSIDPLLPPECGRDTAALIPNAVYVEVEGMGHDMPPGLNDVLIGHIVGHAKANVPETVDS